jgi:hypothetical protein
MLDGEWLLSHLTTPHRSELLMHVREIHEAINMLNGADRFGKACCWLGADDTPAFGLEQLVRQIVSHDLARAAAAPSISACDLRDVVGSEWWLQLRRPSQDIPFHHDTNWNDAEAGGSEPLTFPSCSSVTYLSDVGGPTIVLSPSDPSLRPWRVGAGAGYDALLNRTVHAASRHDAFVSYPAWGKHVRFRGNLYHGSLDELHAFTTRGERISRALLDHASHARGPLPAQLSPQ